MERKSDLKIKRGGYYPPDKYQVPRTCSGRWEKQTRALHSVIHWSSIAIINDSIAIGPHRYRI